MKIKFRFKQKMLTLCCIPMVLLTVISLVLGLAQFKDGMYKETKSSLYSSAIAALNLYQSQGYGDYALKTDGSIIGAMMASQSADGLNSMVQRYILISVAVSCVILVAVILFIFVYIGSLTRVLHDVRRVLLKVTMGDFSDARLIRIKRTDEFGELAQGTEKLRVKIADLLSETQRGTEKLKQAVEQLNVTSDRVIAAAKETSLNIDQISTTANTQKEDTRNATEDVETTNSAINLMLDHISDISTLSNDMENSSRESQAILEELLQSRRSRKRICGRGRTDPKTCRTVE